MDQLSLFNDDSEANKTTKIQNGEYLFIPDFLEPSKASFYFHFFLDKINWKQEEMKMYGKVLKFPRLTAWYGDSSRGYTFSGITLKPNSWIDELLDLKNLIEPVSKVHFNSVLLNLYRNGNGSISWHTDAEKELGKNPVIASLNLGASRKFQLRHQQTKEKIEINLTSGSLLIMQGELQHYWQHQIPKTRKFIGGRINLTFRLIK